MKFTIPRVTSSWPTLVFWTVLVALVTLLAPHTASGLGLMGLAFAGAVMDSRAEFCDATALNTGAAASYLVGNVMDLSVVRDIGNGRQVYCVISVDTAVTSTGAATTAFQLASDAQAAIAVDGSQTVHYTSAVIPKATLVAGYQIVFMLPLELPAYEQFLGIIQVQAVAPLSAGKINAFLTLDPPRWKAYKNDPNIV